MLSNRFFQFLLFLTLSGEILTQGTDGFGDKDALDWGNKNTKNPYNERKLNDGMSRLYQDDFDDENFETGKKNVKPMDTALAVIYGTITVVGLIANGIVFFVIFGRSEISKTVTAMYVVQLASADSLFLFTLPIFGMQKVTGNWTFGQDVCKLCQIVKFLNYYAGIFFLTAMSVDRYVAVAYSTKAHQLRTKQRTIYVCLFVWVLSAVMSLPTGIYARTITNYGSTFCKLTFPGYQAPDENSSYLFLIVSTEEEYPDEEYASGEYYLPGEEEEYVDLNETFIPDFRCSHDYESNAYRSWIVVNFVIGFLVPFLVITISYALIIMKLRDSEEKIATMTGKKTQNMRRRVTRMVAALVICFVICWLPYHIVLLLKLEGLNISVTACNAVEQFLVALGFSNSAINPILYTFLGHNFKERLRESIDQTKRRFRKGSMASAAGHFTRSHSDQGHNSFTRRLSNIVGLRRSSKASSGNDVDGSNKESQSSRRSKYGIPLLELHKKGEQKTGWKYDSEQHERTECNSRYHSNQTEFTRIVLDKDAKKESNEIVTKFVSN